MHKYNQLRRRFRPEQLLHATWLGTGMVSLVAAAAAQTVPASGTGKTSWMAQKITQNAQGIRLEGKASITTPEMSVAAPLIELNRTGGASITEIRGHQSVSFKMNTTPRGGGVPVHIDVHSNEATADLVKSTLVLTGNVDGEYTIGKGQPNKLHGSQATLTFVNQTLNVEVEGGADGVRLELPPEPATTPTQTAPALTDAKVATLGTVVITAQRATLNTVLKEGDAAHGAGNPGTARFIGNAHAVSTDGPTKFDVAAPEFRLTRAAAGGIDTLTTVGRTHLVVDFPPPPDAGLAPVAVQLEAAANEPPHGANAALKKVPIGRPTHVEADADALVVTRPTDTMTLTGNVTGFYRLPPTPPAAGQAAPGQPTIDNQPRDFHFTEDRVQLHYDPKQGVSMVGEGNPGVIETPGFDLKFGQ